MNSYIASLQPKKFSVYGNLNRDNSISSASGTGKNHSTINISIVKETFPQKNTIDFYKEKKLAPQVTRPSSRIVRSKSKKKKSSKSPTLINSQSTMNFGKNAFGTYEQQTQLDNKYSEPKLKQYNDYFQKNDTDVVKKRHPMESLGQMSTRMPTNTLTSRNQQASGRATLKDKSSQLLQKYRSKKTNTKINRPTIASKSKSVKRTKSTSGARKNSTSIKSGARKLQISSKREGSSFSRNKAKINQKSFNSNILFTQNSEVFTPSKHGNSIQTPGSRVILNPFQSQPSRNYGDVSNKTTKVVSRKSLKRVSKKGSNKSVKSKSKISRSRSRSNISRNISTKSVKNTNISNKSAKNHKSASQPRKPSYHSLKGKKPSVNSLKSQSINRGRASILSQKSKVSNLGLRKQLKNLEFEKTLLQEELEHQKMFTLQIESQLRSEIQDVMSLMNGGDQDLVNKIDELMRANTMQKIQISQLEIQNKILKMKKKRKQASKSYTPKKSVRIRKSKSICSNNSDLNELFPQQFSAEKNYQDVISGPRMRKRKSVVPRSPSPIFGKKMSGKKINVNKKMLITYRDTCDYLQSELKKYKFQNEVKVNNFENEKKYLKDLNDNLEKQIDSLERQVMDQNQEIQSIKAFDPQVLYKQIETLNQKITEIETGRESYRKRFLEEREAKKCLEEDIKRVEKECRAKISMMSTHQETLTHRGHESMRHEFMKNEPMSNESIRQDPMTNRGHESMRGYRYQANETPEDIDLSHITSYQSESIRDHTTNIMEGEMPSTGRHQEYNDHDEAILSSTKPAQQNNVIFEYDVGSQKSSSIKKRFRYTYKGGVQDQISNN